jgi:histidinol-phosphate aminotransferase
MPFEGQAKEIFEQLKQHNVLIKCLAGGHPLLENCLRFTIGTENENGLLLDALKDIL